MSTEYTMVVKRKQDDKKIAEFSCNAIKSLIDSEYSHIIHTDDIRYSMNENGCKFTFSELQNMRDMIYRKISENYSDIRNNQMMICLSKSKDHINDLKEENKYLQECIDEDLKWQIFSISEIIGQVSCVTEDLYKKGTPAYSYNAKDLKGRDTIWCDDIYCEVYAS